MLHRCRFPRPLVHLGQDGLPPTLRAVNSPQNKDIVERNVGDLVGYISTIFLYPAAYTPMGGSNLPSVHLYNNSRLSRQCGTESYRG